MENLKDILKFLNQKHPNLIRDLSLDVYCPKTYSHHLRLTLWLPWHRVEKANWSRYALHAKELLKKMRAKHAKDYVLGLNSRLDQYEQAHLLMLDLDDWNQEVEVELTKLGGFLFQSGRGFHFIGAKPLHSRKEWEKLLRSLKRNRSLKGAIDIDHIELSLKRGYSTLRLTRSPIKPKLPKFYKKIGKT